MFKNWNWDAIGISASLACAIHCALLPLFFSSLPLLGINILHNYQFEFGMILVSFAIGAYSLYHGYKKHHHSFKPIILFSIGIAIMFSRMVFREIELYLLFPAAILIIYAHVNNHMRCRVHNHAHADDCDH
jgi:MerC mercury resistance protein